MKGGGQLYQSLFYLPFKLNVMMSEMYYLKQEIAKLPSGKIITASLLLTLIDRASEQQSKDQKEIEDAINF